MIAPTSVMSTLLNSQLRIELLVLGVLAMATPSFSAAGNDRQPRTHVAKNIILRRLLNNPPNPLRPKLDANRLGAENPGYSIRRESRKLADSIWTKSERIAWRRSGGRVMN